MRRWIGLGLILTILTGCGGGQDVRIIYEEAPLAPAPVPAGRPVPLSRPGIPSAAPPTQTLTHPVASPAVTSPAVPSSAASGAATTRAAGDPGHPAPPSTVSHLVALRMAGTIFPRVYIHLTNSATGEVVQDVASPDTQGLEGRLSRLEPGRYLMRLSSEVLPDYPIFEKGIMADGKEGTLVTVGWVYFKLPPEGSWLLRRGMELVLLEEPSRRPVFKGPLEQAVMHDVSGKAHPDRLLLPPGEYTYGVRDISPDDSASIRGEGPTTASIEPRPPNGFVLTEENPGVIVDLTQAFDI